MQRHGQVQQTSFDDTISLDSSILMSKTKNIEVQYYNHFFAI